MGRQIISPICQDTVELFVALKSNKLLSLGLHPNESLERKSQQEEKVFWVSEEELGGTKEEEANRDGSDTEWPIEVKLASTM